MERAGQWLKPHLMYKENKKKQNRLNDLTTACESGQQQGCLMNKKELHFWNMILIFMILAFDVINKRFMNK